MITINKEIFCDRVGVESFASTALAEALQRIPALSTAGPWLAGGSVRRAFQREPLDTDLDFFFQSEEQKVNFAVGLAAMGGALVKKNQKNEQWILPSCVEKKDDKTTHFPELNIQLVYFRFYDTVEQVLDSFDFTICQFGYDGISFYASDFALWDLARKRLVPHRLTFATDSLRRVLKYTSQGFTICSGGLSSILQQVAARPEIINSQTMYVD